MTWPRSMIRILPGNCWISTTRREAVGDAVIVASDRPHSVVADPAFQFQNRTPGGVSNRTSKDLGPFSGQIAARNLFTAV